MGSTEFQASIKIYQYLVQKLLNDKNVKIIFNFLFLSVFLLDFWL